MRLKIPKILWNAATLAVMAAAIAMLGYAVSGTPLIARVEGASMEPGYGSGDVYACVPGWREGEAAVLDDPNQDRVLVKRIVAVGPCHVSWDEDGALRVDGIMLDEPYARYGAGRPGECDVADGQVFVAGDNRHASYDSRSFGPVDAGCIRGRFLAKLKQGDGGGEPDEADP